MEISKCCGLGALMSVLTCLPWSVLSASGDPAQLRLPADSVRTRLGTGMQIQGLPLHAEVFQTSASLRDTADLIASQADTSPALLLLPGALLLAWQSGPHHWLARLTQVDESLTRGAVSVLTLPDREVNDASAGQTRSRWPWLPVHATLLFAFDSAHGTKQLRQGVYRHDWLPSNLGPHLHERLRQTGWQRQDDEPGQTGVEHWTQGTRSLTVLLAPVSGGSGLWFVESVAQ